MPIALNILTKLSLLYLLLLLLLLLHFFLRDTEETERKDSERRTDDERNCRPEGGLDLTSLLTVIMVR